MATSSTLRVMISSRCKDKFPRNNGRTLEEIREDLKTMIESIKIFDHQVFEVWLSQGAPPASGRENAWQHCLSHVKECDILLVLSNGNAGWALATGGNGICHEELMTGLLLAPGKVRLIDLGKIRIRKSPAGERNRRFQEYVDLQYLFHGGTVTTEDELFKRVEDTLADVLVSLAQYGVREASRGKFDRGQALDWDHLDFATRQEEMKRALRNAVMERPGSRRDAHNLVIKLGNRDILLIPHAMPAAFSVGPAREMVGQPFLLDHELDGYLVDGRGGPLHVIACHRSATESQAMRLLGFSDATIVSTTFGVFVADNIQKIQFAFIANCRDEATTRHGVSGFFEWLEQTGEEFLVAKRADSRAEIVHAIAGEYP